MKQEEINLENLGISRKRLKTGDVFVFKPKGHPFYYGLVVNANADMFGVKGLKHIHLFDCSSEMDDRIPETLQTAPLLTPPILTNQLAWSKGYFKTIGHVPIDYFPSVKEATFFYFTGKLFDDTSHKRDKPKSLSFVGAFAVTSYLNIDNMISLALGIPLAVMPPDQWNPYWYRERLSKDD